MRPNPWHRLAACALVLGALAGGTRAQAHSSDLSLLSAIPLAVSVAPAAVSTLAASGAVLTVVAVEASARGTVYVLERASDGARVSIEVSSDALGAASAVVGTSVQVTALGAGLVLSAAGQAIAFIPNALGRALLHDEKVSR